METGMTRAVDNIVYADDLELRSLIRTVDEIRDRHSYDDKLCEELDGIKARLEYVIGNSRTIESQINRDTAETALKSCKVGLGIMQSIHSELMESLKSPEADYKCIAFRILGKMDMMTMALRLVVNGPGNRTNIN